MLTEEQLQRIEKSAEPTPLFYWVARLVSEIRLLRRVIHKLRDAKGYEHCRQNDLELYQALDESLPENPGSPCLEELPSRCQEYYEQQAQGEQP